MDFPGLRIGRYDCAHGNTVTVNHKSCNLKGPLKLYVNGPLDRSVDRFIEFFAVDINGVRHYLSLGKENVVECKQGGILEINFVLKTYQPRSGAWEKGMKHWKMRYYDDFNFAMSTKVEY